MTALSDEKATRQREIQASQAKRRYNLSLFIFLAGFTLLFLPSMSFPTWSKIKRTYLSLLPMDATQQEPTSAWNFWETQGQYGPFLTPRNLSEEVLPDGCEIDQVTLLHRHTSRYPTLDLLISQYAIVEKILSSPSIRNASFISQHPELEFLAGYGSVDDVLSGWKAEELTDLGRRRKLIFNPAFTYSAYDSGLRTRSRYTSLLSTAENINPLFTRSSDSGRVVETAGYWLKGFQGEEFEIVGRKRLERPRVVMKTGRKYNSTLHQKDCPTTKRLSVSLITNDSDYTSSKITHPLPLEFLRKFAPPLACYLNTILQPTEPITMEDIVPLMSLCAFDIAAQPLESVLDPQEGADPETALERWYEGARRRRDGWCGIWRGLSEDEERQAWEGCAYLRDITKYYEKSSGSPFGATQGVGYVNELLARLQDGIPEDHTNTNRTLNADEATFPRGGRRLFVDFGHDNEMLKVLAAMDIMTEDSQLLPVWPPPPDHVFKQYRLTPFGATFAFERIKCVAGSLEPPSTHVRIFINNVRTQVKHPACRKGRYAEEYGLCELGDFVRSQLFSRTSGYGRWAKCHEGE